MIRRNGSNKGSYGQFGGAMDKNKYIKMNSNEMYNHLITDVLENSSEGKLLIEELAQSDRYVQDYEFRALVETVRGLTYLMDGEVDRTISFL